MYVLETYGYHTVRVAPADVSAPFKVRGNVCLRHKPELGLSDLRWCSAQVGDKVFAKWEKNGGCYRGKVKEMHLHPADGSKRTGYTIEWPGNDPDSQVEPDDVQREKP